MIGHPKSVVRVRQSEMAIKKRGVVSLGHCVHNFLSDDARPQKSIVTRASSTMSQLGYDLLRASTPKLSKYYQPHPDRAAPVSLLHRIATVAIERIILMMNNTLLLTKHHRLADIYEAVDYLLGNHDDVGCNGDRGDFYRRKLAEQIYVNFGVHYITHTNVLNLVRDAIQLEADTRITLSHCGLKRDSAPPIQVDDQVLDVLARIADMH